MVIDIRLASSGIRGPHQSSFTEATQALLVGVGELRQTYGAEELESVFTDILHAGGGITYADGRPACLGAYNALLDYEAVRATCAVFSSNELELIVCSLRQQACLSPSFALLASWIELFGERSTIVVS